MNQKICSIKECNRKYYAKGYCHSHYSNRLVRLSKGQNPDLSIKLFHECKILNCKRQTLNKYCWIHTMQLKRRIKRGLSLDLNIKLTCSGARNVNWKGGVSRYPNHYLMKKQRLIVLFSNPKCEYCGKPATCIHHKDENKSNHKLSNLAAICNKCNITFGSKYYKKYGMTLTEIAMRLNISVVKASKHRKEICEFLDKEEKINASR